MSPTLFKLLLVYLKVDQHIPMYSFLWRMFLIYVMTPIVNTTKQLVQGLKMLFLTDITLVLQSDLTKF